MSNARDKANIPSLNFSSTGIDDNATSTALTINGANNATFSGIVTADEFNFSTSGDLHAGSTASSVAIAGGTNSNVGANVNLYGSTHASLANVVRFRADASETMRITSTGSLGINTSSPAPAVGSDKVLEIAGSTSPGLVINDTGQAQKYQLYADSTKFKMSYGTTGFFTYDASNANLGIGTNSPSEKLEVNGTVKATAFQGDGSALTGGGITEADQFRLTANLTAVADPISANLERVDDATFAKIGTGMTLSSGVYTFPRTGLYQVESTVMLSWINDSDSIQVEMYASSNSGSTYDQIARIAVTMPDGVFVQTYSNKTFVNVTDASTFRVKFVLNSLDANNYLTGSTETNYTFFTFIRLGDSQ